jgi:hypothetical protein
VALPNQLLTVIGCATILPDNGVVNRLTGIPIPYDGRLPLISNADGSHIGCFDLSCLQSLQSYRDLGGYDLFRIVLDPAWLRKDLIELPLRNGADSARFVEQ